MIWNNLRFLHQNLPFPLLKLWSILPNLKDYTVQLAYGGQRYNNNLKLISNMQDWSTNQVYEYQYEKLRKILVHAYSNVPYYKNSYKKEGIKPGDIKCIEDLQKLPTISKEIVLAHYDRFFSKDQNRNDFVKYWYTSGTTGQSLRVNLDKNVIAANTASLSYWYRKYLSYNPINNYALHSPANSRLLLLFLGNSFFVNKLKKNYVHSPLLKNIIFVSNHVDDSIFADYVHAIKRYKIKHLSGFPSICFYFAKYLKENRISLSIDTINLKGEVLYPYQRKIIEKARI